MVVLNLEASKLGREYKDIQREIIVADIKNKKRLVIIIKY